MAWTLRVKFKDREAARRHQLDAYTSPLGRLTGDPEDPELLHLHFPPVPDEDDHHNTLSAPLPDRAVLGLDVQVDTVNETGQPCRMVDSSATVDVFALVRAPVGHTFALRTTNTAYNAADVERFHVSVTVVARPTHADAMVASWPRRSVSGAHDATILENLTLRMVDQNMGHQFPPRHPCFARMCAPRYLGTRFLARTSPPKALTLPGMAYFAKAPPVVTERTAMHWLALVRDRRSEHNDTPFAALSVADAAPFMAALCTGPTQQDPYLGDVFPGPNPYPVDAFGDALATGSGDCEDAAQATVRLHGALVRDGPTYTSSAGRHLYRVASQYVCCAVLSAVAAPSFEGGSHAHVHDNPEQWAAHMSARFIPRAHFERQAGLARGSGGGGADTLPTLVGEGTSAVACDFRDGPRPLLDRSLTDLLRDAVPPGYEVQSHPRWSDGPASFYKWKIHAYCPYYWAQDQGTTPGPVPTVLSYVDDQGRLGVPDAGPKASGGRLHVWSGGPTASERALIDTYDALETPPPVLQVDTVGATTLAQRRAHGTTLLPLPSDVWMDAAAAARSDPVPTATVFCATPDATARTTWVNVLRQHDLAVVDCVAEQWYDDDTPVVRMEVARRSPQC